MVSRRGFPPSSLKMSVATKLTMTIECKSGACKRVFHSVGAVDPSKCSIWPKVDFANRERDAARIPPIRDVLGFGPCFEDHSARRIEDARQHNLVVRGSSDCERSGVRHR